MATQTVTNEDLMDVMQDMMQLTNDRFDHMEGRMDRIEGRLSRIEGHVDRIGLDLADIKTKLLQHDLQLAALRRITQELTDKHSAYINDIADILDRIMRLEKHMPYVSREELYELQQLLQHLVDWAIKAAKTVKVPLELP